ncbi:MAG: TonB-dependent receptor [Acidobacteriota bacterium]|nr:TonB-dependent receptor [Acidobacteriota bacterium]
MTFHSVRSLAFVCSLLFASTLFAGPVTGRVVDPSGRAVAGATVLVSGAGFPLRSVLTDEGGAFTVVIADTGKFDVRVAVPGFRSEVLQIDSSSAQDLGTIRLAISALSESVVVSASQVDIPLSQAASTVTVITAADLRARQVHSLADALRTVPGLTVASTGGYGAVTGVFPRGGESNFTLVFVDDVPVNAFGGEYDFAHLTTENVERIEIVRGPQSALFGSNAIGSVVRVVTRRGGAPSISGSVEGGGYGTTRLAGASSGSIGAFEWGASGERFTSDGFNGQTFNGFTVQNDDYSRSSGALIAGWRVRDTAIRAQFGHSVDERGAPGPFGANPIGAFEAIDTISRGDNEQTLASITATVPLASRVRSTFQGAYHRLQSNFASPFGESESNSRRWSGRAQIDFPVIRGLDVSAGAELQSEEAGSTFITGAAFQPVPVERVMAGYFVEGRWTAAPRVQITGGLRLDDIRRRSLEQSPDPFTPRPAMEEDSVLSLNPKLALAWTTRGGSTDFTKLRGSVGTGIRPPGAFDLAFTDNPSLKPERSFSSEVAIEQAFAGGRASAEAVAFFNDYDDLIVAVGSFRESSRYTTDNISNARARGIELSLGGAHRVASLRDLDLDARLSYAWLESEVLAVDNDDTAPPPFTVGEPLLRRPQHQFSAELTGTTGPLTMFVSGGARSRVLDVEPSFGTFGGLHYADGFNAWNAGAAWRVRRIGEIFGRVENLFDRTYEEALGFPALGRRATIGIRVAPGR